MYSQYKEAIIMAKNIDLRTLQSGTQFYVEDGAWGGYVYEKDGKHYAHIYEDYPGRGNGGVIELNDINFQGNNVTVLERLDFSSQLGVLQNNAQAYILMQFDKIITSPEVTTNVPEVTEGVSDEAIKGTSDELVWDILMAQANHIRDEQPAIQPYDISDTIVSTVDTPMVNEFIQRFANNDPEKAEQFKRHIIDYLSDKLEKYFERTQQVQKHTDHNHDDHDER